MKLIVLTGAGEQQTIVVNGIATLTDRSGTIADAAEPQELMAANADRGGWYFQNLSTYGMLINEIGEDADEDGGFLVRPGESFPPPNYPVTVEAISVKAIVPDGDEPAEDSIKFTAREW